jgi:MOSC domain-containing protein YiiM
MAGRIVAVSISRGKGERKSPAPSAELRENHGIVGDAHAGEWHRQVSLLALESIEKMQRLGLSVGAGDFAENITTHGIDLVNLAIGTRLTVGDVVLEVTQIGKECHNRCAIFYQAGDCVMPKEGIFAKVVKGGLIRPMDAIDVQMPAGTEALRPAARRRYKNPKKPNIISVRITDEEMEVVQQLMDATSKRASEVMREAFILLKSEWREGGLVTRLGGEQVASCM